MVLSGPSTFSRPYRAALQRAAALVAGDPLLPDASPSVQGLLKVSAAWLHQVRLQDLDNLLGWDGDADDWLAHPVYPLGCSVGGGVARLPDLKGLTREQIVEHNRRFIRAVVDITSEGSAAGYDSHGISLSVLDIATNGVEILGAKTSGDIDERGHITVSRLLKMVPGLESGKAFILVCGAQTRAATQGDNMYSSANAHLHTERMTREVLDEVLSSEDLARVRSEIPLRIDREGPFHVGHNGDVNSKIRWERYFLEKGFQSEADSDSKEIPRLHRLIYECLSADALLQRGEESSCLAWLLKDLGERRVLRDSTVLDEAGAQVDRSLKAQQACLLELAAALRRAGASTVAVASALSARLISFVDPTSVYTFETLTSIRERADSLVPVTTLVRGPKAGGMVIYRDLDDPSMPFKFASSLANLRGQIRRYENESHDQVPVDYITTGARVLIREGTVPYHALGDWQMAELRASAEDGGEPALRFYHLLTGELLEPAAVTSPIVDYRLQGKERSATLKAVGAFKDKSRVDRSLVYDSVLGEITAGPTPILRRQVKDLAMEEPVHYAVDNQYGAEILLSFVTLLRNTRQLFKGRIDDQGRLQSEVTLRSESLFRLEADHLTASGLDAILRGIRTVIGLGEGTSRNVLGMAFAAAELEGLNGVHTSALESNLARMQSPRIDRETLLTFVSNSGGTKPVVALAEETLDRLGDSWREGPYVWAVTNLVTSELAGLAFRSLGASVTNLPWERAVGSTYAAFTAFQNLLAMLVRLHEARGVLKPGRARHLYRSLASFPQVARATLAYPAARDEVGRLARWIAGNNVDVAFVGALEGFDAAEGALKFAEMMQHTRVKFYSGAYEQHGQRATYLRELRTNPGTLVILNVPNLDTTIGSWSAQLIREDLPRCGKIAVLCAQEDAMELRESGADFVIPAPEGTTGCLFSDMLTKMILANMLTEATIEVSNGIADQLSGWGNRLLDRAEGMDPVPASQVAVELKRLRKDFARLDDGDHPRRERIEACLELERQAVSGMVTEVEREDKLAELYRSGRQLSSAAAESRQRVTELLQILTEEDLSEEAEVFDRLLWDLVLELSDRGLAMRVADERFQDDPERARTAVHYQGLAKILGANPIKPDNIAKFQQGWGIASFLLPPGRRRSHGTTLLAPSLLGDRGSWLVDPPGLLRVGYPPESVERLELFSLLVDPDRTEVMEASFLGDGRPVFTARSGDPVTQASTLHDRIRGTGEPGLEFEMEGNRMRLVALSLDPFGDPDQLVLVEGRLKSLSDEEQEAIIWNSDHLKRRRSLVQGWISGLGKDVRDQIDDRITPAKLLAFDEIGLRDRVEGLAARAELAGQIPGAADYAASGFDLLDVTVENLETFKNVLTAMPSVRGSAVYLVKKRSIEGRPEFMSIQDTDSLRGVAVGRGSRYGQWGKLLGNKRIAAAGRKLKMGYGVDNAAVVILPAENAQGTVFKLLLVHPEIEESLSVEDRIRTLGGKYRLIVDHASEYIEWNDRLLESVSMVDLLMLSDEEIANERIVPLARRAADASGKKGV